VAALEAPAPRLPGLSPARDVRGLDEGGRRGQRLLGALPRLRAGHEPSTSGRGTAECASQGDYWAVTCSAANCCASPRTQSLLLLPDRDASRELREQTRKRTREALPRATPDDGLRPGRRCDYLVDRWLGWCGRWCFGRFVDVDTTAQQRDGMGDTYHFVFPVPVDRMDDLRCCVEPLEHRAVARTDVPDACIAGDRPFDRHCPTILLRASEQIERRSGRPRERPSRLLPCQLDKRDTPFPVRTGEPRRPLALENKRARVRTRRNLVFADVVGGELQCCLMLGACHPRLPVSLLPTGAGRRPCGERCAARRISRELARSSSPGARELSRTARKEDAITHVWVSSARCRSRAPATGLPNRRASKTPCK